MHLAQILRCLLRLSVIYDHEPYKGDRFVVNNRSLPPPPRTKRSVCVHYSAKRFDLHCRAFLLIYLLHRAANRSAILRRNYQTNAKRCVCLFRACTFIVESVLEKIYSPLAIGDPLSVSTDRHGHLGTETASTASGCHCTNNYACGQQDSGVHHHQRGGDH